VLQWLRRNFDTCFIVLQVWVDGLAIFASFFLGYGLYERIAPGATSLAFYRELVLVIVAVTLVCFWISDLYRWRKSILNVEEYRGAFKATLLSFLTSASCIFLLRAVAPDQLIKFEGEVIWLYKVLLPVHDLLRLDPAVEMASRVLFVFVFVCIFVLTVVQRAIMFHVASRLHARGFGNTNVAVYGTGELAMRVQQKLRLFPTLGFNFVGFVDDDEALRGRRIRGHEVLGGRHELDRLREAHGVKRIIVADDGLDEYGLAELCRICDDLGIDYQVVPRLHHFFSQRFTVDFLDSIPMLSVGDRSHQPVYKVVKRGIDLLVSLTVLVVTSPLMAAIAILIKRESSGPVLFSQVRVGAKGRTFRMLKFRTMYVEMCGDDITPQSQDDPRITRVGRFLRRTSMDELPQFWCVLRGDMSLVGPRPEMPFIVDTYKALDRLRLDAKPGITGLWQVSEARRHPIHENLDYDFYYIENQSIFLDMVILFMTAMTLLRIRSTA